MSKETKVNNLKINKLTKAQYESSTQSDTELYFVTDDTLEMSDINGLQTALAKKQDTISDLATIRSGASKGATALQSSDVINNVTTTTTDKPLSANMGKELQDQIDNLKARGRYLSQWNSSTGLAETEPTSYPYDYKAGDYFIVGVVGTTNYKPDGSQYTGTASTVVETASVAVEDVYYYDGNTWHLQQNTQKTVSFANLAGQPTDNTNLATALNAKQDTISDLSTIRSNAEAGKSASDTIATYGDIVTHNTSEFQTTISDLDTIRSGAALGATSIQNTNDCVHLTGDETVAGVKTFTSDPIISVSRSDYISGLSIQNKNLTKGSTFTGERYNSIDFLANNGTTWKDRTALFENRVTSSKSDLRFIAYNPTKTTPTASDLAEISISMNSSSVATTSAPAPTEDTTTSTQIDTVGARNTKITSAISTHNTSTTAHEDIREKIKDIELFKFPNAIIIGSPTIQSGQVSGFSTSNYMQFPFVVDVRNKSFEIDFCFTTGSNVTTQQNIMDSKFGLALAIANGKGLMAMSSNGTNWDIGSTSGTYTIAANTTYYAKVAWDGTAYTTALSTDGETYTTDMTLTSSAGLYPTTIYIGGGSATGLGRAPNPFGGSINFNKCYLYVAGLLVWQGMDDAGLATRADVSLSNLDSLGEARFNAKQDTLTAGDNITIENNVISATGGVNVSYDSTNERMIFGG